MKKNMNWSEFYLCDQVDGGPDLNLPNILTVIRLLLVPVFSLLFVMGNYIGAVIVFVFCGITDIVDGYIARKYSMVTPFGKLMDPVADKILQVTALVLLTWKDLIPLPVVLAVSLKEFTMLIGSAVLYKRKVVVFANWYGKLATVLLFFAIIWNIYLDYLAQNNIAVTQAFRLIADVSLAVAVFTTLMAFVGYLIQFIKTIKGKKVVQVD